VTNIATINLFMAGKTATATKMTAEHKAALAEGRAQGRAVRNYLEALERNKPKRGRRRTPTGIKKRLDAIDAEINAADPLKRVQLIQERMDLLDELENATSTVDIDSLEKDFIRDAAAYSQRKGISYAAWRELGVPASVLRSAGISRAA
jgi:uncharacterized protein YicC (UPF0701 family)